MLIFRSKLVHMLLGAAVIAGSSCANAEMVNYTINGSVIDGGFNVFGLSGGSSITASGQFENSALTNGNGVVSFDSFSGNTMTISIGTEVVTEMNDLDYYIGGKPSLSFTGGLLSSFDYASFWGVNDATADFQSYSLNFDDFDLMWGEWDPNVIISTTGTSPVPVPAAVWLFGSGLLGLIGFAKKK